MSAVISVSAGIMSGTSVFAGTRVPVTILFDYPKAGESINDFLAGFPTVTRAQVVRVLEELGQQLSDKVA